MLNVHHARQPGDEEAVTLLTRMVQIYSPSTEEQEIAAFLVQQMSEWGLEAYRDAVGNAVGHIGEGRRHVVLLGHTDTFPGQLPVRREGNLLYGRGTVDAKGPMAAFLVAAARMRPLPGLKLTVIGAVEEETYSSAGAHYAVELYRPDLAIIGEPSRWNRITLGYKGVWGIRYRLQRPMAHTAGQQRGVCEEAVEFWQQMVSRAEAYNVGKTARFDTLDPSLRRIHSQNDAFQEWVEMEIGFRLPLGLALEDLRAEVEAQRGDADIESLNYEPPFRAEKSNALCSAMLYAIRAEGGQPAFVYKTGTSDMNVVGPVWKCPIVAYGPGDSSLDHTPDEHMDLQEYLQAIHVLTRALQRLAA